MNTKNNQRSRETDDRIVRTVFTILTEENKPLSKITVSEVCKRSGINRSTFYAHYMDIYDIAEKVDKAMAEGVARHVLNRLEKEQRVDACFIALFEYISENREFYSLYFSKLNRSGVIGVAWELLQNKTDSLNYADFGLKSAEELVYQGEFFMYGLTAMLRHWVLGGCAESPDEMLGILVRQYSNVSQKVLAMNGHAGKTEI